MLSISFLDKKEAQCGIHKNVYAVWVTEQISSKMPVLFNTIQFTCVALFFSLFLKKNVAYLSCLHTSCSDLRFVFQKKNNKAFYTGWPKGFGDYGTRVVSSSCVEMIPRAPRATFSHSESWEFDCFNRKEKLHRCDTLVIQ